MTNGIHIGGLVSITLMNHQHQPHPMDVDYLFCGFLGEPDI